MSTQGLTPTGVRWLVQRAAAVPAADDWLSPGERDRLASLRLPRRRADFRLGRWTAKQAVAGLLGPAAGLPLARIEISAAPSGAPEVQLDGVRAQLAISLSHRDAVALCVVASGQVRLGCDLEVVEDHGAAFLSDYFTAEEQELVASAPAAVRPQCCTLLWSAKESALKALTEGLRLDTREVVVSLPSPHGGVHWSPLRVRHTPAGEIFDGFFRIEAPLVMVVVASPAPAVPQELQALQVAATDAGPASGPATR